MSEKILGMVRNCACTGFNMPWMEYLRGRIVRVKKNGNYNYIVTTSSIPVKDRGYWIIQKKDVIVITPEIRTQLIEIFRKDRSMFVLKDKKKE